MKTIWTRAARDLLYEQLTIRFGPFENWESSSSPSKAQRAAFNKFCNDFAPVIGAKSGRAVVHQIQWAIGVRSSREHHWTGAQSRNAVLNMALAFQAGFIRHADFPAIVARNHKQARGDKARAQLRLVSE